MRMLHLGLRLDFVVFCLFSSYFPVGKGEMGWMGLGCVQAHLCRR